MGQSEIPGAAEAPIAAKKPHYTDVHGYHLEDDYYWMRDRDDPGVRSYLETENAYTQTVMAPTEGLQAKLYDEMLGRIKETDQSVPVKYDQYLYYYRTEEGKAYTIQCRKKDSPESPEEIILDINRLAQGHDYTQVGAMAVSPDHRLLAYAVDFKGSEVYTLYIKNLETGELLNEEIEGISPDIEWAEDSKTLFYVLYDQAQRPYRLMRHVLGQKIDEDAFIYEEKDELFLLSVDKTKDKKYLVLTSSSKTASEAHILPSDRPGEKFQRVQMRRNKVEYYIEHHNDRFFILTNQDDAVNFKVMITSEHELESRYWHDFIAHRPDVKIEDIELMKDFIVTYEREQGLTELHVHPFDGSASYRIDMPEPVYTAWGGSNIDFNSHQLRFIYTSLVTPASVFDFNLKTRERTLLKQKEVLGGYEPSLYQTERVFARSHDGVMVPISIVYKKDLRHRGPAPMLLYGYGSYGITIDPEFGSNRLSLLDRGIIFAIAHIRGGGHLGRPWYEAGKFLNKKNTFEDFIACAQHLITEKYTDSEKLVIAGGSAGGLLIGAVLNMQPELFYGAVAHVPFVDVANTMLDESLPLTVGEYEEWGNPQDKTYFDYIYSYSPYDHVEVKEYPHLLVTGGLTDPRVQYWEPAKWVAKLRALKSGHNRLLLKMNMDAGHQGASGRYEYLKEIAFEYAFILDILGIPEAPEN